ncbi:hypothetical protein ACTWQF_29370 [Streptomyces sp. 8N114]|uniref:hypothetical protein n=1 Tax=Streptomyces sp. 8N114 TaxID=3457419 RepID=UPI003FD3A482
MTTHNGRGQDGNSGSAGEPLPASTTPYEGVVLPANGDPWTPQQQRQAERERVRPPAGQPWGEPWGPGSEAAHGSTPESGAPEGGPGYWGAPQQDAPGGSLPLPPEGAPALPQTPPVGTPTSLHPPHPASPPSPDGAAPLPPAAAPGAMPLPDGPGAMPSGGPGYAQPAAGLPEPYGASSAGGGAHALPPQQPQSQPQPPSAVPGGSGRHAMPDRSAAPPAPSAPPIAPPVPPAAPPVPPAMPPGAPQGGVDDSDATQMLPPLMTGPPPAAGPVGADDGTQLLPPQQPAGPVGGGPDSEATQYLPPVAGGVDSDSEATQMLPPMSGEGGAPGAGGPGAGVSGLGEPGARRPLPEFDNLFRSDSPRTTGPGQPAAGNNEPGSTQSLPIFDQAAQQQAPPRGGYGYPQPAAQRGGYGYPQPGAPRGGYGYPQQPPGPQGGGAGYGYPQPGSQQYEPQVGGRAARRDAERGRRKVSPWLLITGALVGVAAIGLVVGLLLANGGDDSGGDEPKASSAPAEEKSSAAPDPAEGQAKKLDALLADSNNSRSTVVRSVQNIRTCKLLGKAATDLRSAARQRTGLVRRLGELKTDRIPNSAELNSALKSAWRSSASADSHYAAWADQVARKKGCHKGKAKPTSRLAAGNRASGNATTAKKKAAGLWNPTAKKYGLTERQFGAL